MFGHAKEGCEDLQRKKSESKMNVEEAVDSRKDNEGLGATKDRWQTVQRPKRPRRFDVQPQVLQHGSHFTVLEGEPGGETLQREDTVEGTKQVQKVNNGTSQETGPVKDLRKQGKQSFVSDGKKSSKGIKMKSVETREQGENPMLEGKINKTSASSKMKLTRTPLREIQQVQISQDCVPESNMDAHRSKGVGNREKENLHPGDPDAGANVNVAMELEEGLYEEGLVQQSGGNGLGAANKGVAAVVRDMKRRYRIDIGVVLEPRISGSHATKIIRSWGFKHSRRVEAQGFSGGIWILWERDDLVVEVLLSGDQFLHCKVDLGGISMLFTAIYANPNERSRHCLWEELSSISRDVTEPWLLAGDFNDIKSPLEQKGGGRINATRCGRFNEWIQECKLLDIEASGPFFTWRGPKWDGLERVFKRLDRCLCNILWQETFSTAEARVVPRIGSDHHPIVVRLAEEQKNFLVRPFRFQAAWLMHDQFNGLLHENWSALTEAHNNLPIVQQALIKWNKEVFGCIENQTRTYARKLAVGKPTLSCGRVLSNYGRKYWKTLAGVWEEERMSISGRING
ncbi:hypothetical protein K1719_002413 [Acacia pycnantha]|nr:hypothetical protein K1719_002413 [Acacia pycnantha]